MTPRRADLAVKYRFFRNLLSGNDDGAQRAYLWHIDKRIGPRIRAGLATDRWKRSLGDYLISATGLFASMSHRGFLESGAIPVDPDGEIFGGAHRIGCALALGIENVPVFTTGQYVWAPPWHREWFVEHGMQAEDLQRLEADWEAMNA